MRARGRVGVCASAVAALGVLTACSGSHAAPPPCDKKCRSVQADNSSALAALNSPKIVYLLTGAAPNGANVTFIDTTNGKTQQQSNVSVPMTDKASGTQGISFTAIPGQFLYLSAQNDAEGELTCSITENGQVVVTHTSTGAYTLVTCSGTA